ncbi:alpha/beta hydrolase [Metabacillus litoralis]|uniref:Alpha/beta hydrolase n=1 Tax=Metabacillus litoralis TaxID=152268 RepID=A0A5C6VYR6_9BACI|nr:alpha/beta hydrolase [Metabacillus litoralis]TXC90505.1 alpha/beta hydrolase [Metabacillus litoralis]
MKENIIFIHGLTGNQRAFNKQMNYFKGKYNTYSYNLLGHGDDRGQQVDFSLDKLVQQLEELYENKGIDEAHLCALSFGCYPGTIFATKWKYKVSSLCFIGGHYNFPSRLFEVFMHYWDNLDEDYSTWLKKYTNAIYPKGNVFDHYSTLSQKIYYKYGLELEESILLRAIEHRLEYDLRSDLRKLEVPILWVMGEHDYLYKSSLKELNKDIPHVIYREIKYAGHAANLYRPNCFKDMYEEFLVQHQQEKTHTY